MKDVDVTMILGSLISIKAFAQNLVVPKGSVYKGDFLKSLSAW